MATQKEIKTMNNEELFIHMLRMEMKAGREENNRGITKKTVKEYNWTLTELCKRWDMDMEKIKKEMGYGGAWDE